MSTEMKSKQDCLWQSLYDLEYQVERLEQLRDRIENGTVPTSQDRAVQAPVPPLATLIKEADFKINNALLRIQAVVNKMYELLYENMP